MSRIFDALQRSGAEQSGVEYPDLISVVTEVFEANPDRPPMPPEPAVQELIEEVTVAEPEPPMPEVSLKPLSQELSEFPSLSVAVKPLSRLVFFTDPDSLAAEKFRFLSVRLRQIQQNRSIKKVLVTSTIPEEGKTLISANLAGALARRKQKVLLIEGDLRKPFLAKQFGLGRLAGLGEWLKGDHRKITNIYRLDGPDLWFMPAGDAPANALELMQSPNLAQLMAQLSNLFDWIIVDSPPLLPLADTTVWARLTDGTLLVAREGTTRKAMLERGLQVVKKSDLLGVILNGCATYGDTTYYQSHYNPGNK